MKILYNQSGGQLSWVDYIPVLQQTSSGGGSKTPSTSSSKKDDDELDKAIFKALDEKGLDIDNTHFQNTALKLMQSSYYDSMVPGQTTAKLITLKNYANRLNLSKELYDEAVDHVRTNNVGGDFALTSDGKVYVLGISGEGENTRAKIDTISVNEFETDSQKYIPLTNNDLLEIRNNGHIHGIPVKDMLFNTSVLRDVGNAVGMEDIVSDLSKVIKDFGTRKSASYPNLGKSVADGLDVLYKITTGESKAYEYVSENGQMKKDIVAAVKHLYSSLNRNARNVLALHAKMSGTTVENYLADMIIRNTDEEIIPDFEKAPKGSGSGGENKEQFGTESWEHSVFKRHGRPQSIGMILEGRTRFGFKGIRFDMLKGSNGKDVKPITSGIESYNNLQNRGLVAAGQTVYFGNLPLNNISAQGMDLIVDNSDGLAIVYLPTDKDGNLDFSMMQQMSKIQEAIDNERISDPNKKAQYWEKYGFKYNKEQDTGVPHDRELKPFIVQNAYTTEATNSFADPVRGASPLSGNLFFEKVDASIVDQMLAQYNRTAQKGEKLDWSSGWFTDSYRGTIYIPMNDQELQSMISGGEAYSPKLNSNMIKAQQDATRLTGGYNYNTGSFDRTLKGTSDEDLN